MQKNVNGLVDSKIDEKLKQIMEQRNIHNDVTIHENSEDKLDLYRAAANTIREYISNSGFQCEISDDALLPYYEEFQSRFSPSKLAQIKDEELLKYVFFTADQTNESMCYYLEFQPQIKEGCGSISGGSSFKYGLFQRKEDSSWITGSPNKSIELTETEALEKGKDILTKLTLGAKIIEDATLDTLKSYENLDSNLNKTMGSCYSLAWVHKYFHMLFKDKFATWHSNDWQKHILLSFGIKPSDKYYVRSGQLATIAKLANLSMNEFAHASYDCFGDIKHFCRLGTSDKAGKYFCDWLVDGVASIGWNDLDSIEIYKVGNDINKKALEERLLTYYYATDKKMASRKSNEIITYYNAGKDSVFVAMDGQELLALGDNLGDYYYDERKHFAHCKSVEWHCCFEKDEKLPNKSEGMLTTCSKIQDEENLLYLYDKYYRHKDDIVSIQEDDNSEEQKNSIDRESRTNQIHPLNQIIYGAPGTGKTYSSVEYAVAIVENRELNTNNLSIEERKALMQKYSDYVERGNIVFTTFHQSYGYEEFVQGIRPEPSNGNVRFKIVDGVFKTIADKALRDKTENYVIIIDEINRGNISKIFGELITLIEEDKRWGEINEMSVTLPLGERFRVPNNLYIIGTMNSADKSISLIDAALRRRFEFIEMAPNPDLISDEELKRCLINLNMYLRKELRSTDLLIGHSYFIGKTSIGLVEILNKNIIPLLYEYFYDDENKVRKAIECINSVSIVIDENALGRLKVKRRIEND